ncbi:MAG: L,D-transpeptidase [Acidobacteria bacterium]|nr:L,D-transpeptidase [Acidobacteriota bacterium]
MRRALPKSAGRAAKARLAVAAALLLAAAEALAQHKYNKVIEQGRTRPARRLVVSIPDRKLALIEDGRVLKTYPVAVGAAISPSPAGEFKIAQRLANPTYYAPGVVIPPGEDNPLGTRWLGLGVKGYGLHGTNQPGSIGRRASHGCIRLRNRDMQELFELMRVGDAVELHAARSVELAEIFGSAAPGTDAKPASPSASAPVVTVAAGQN